MLQPKLEQAGCSLELGIQGLMSKVWGFIWGLSGVYPKSNSSWMGAYQK